MKISKADFDKHYRDGDFKESPQIEDPDPMGPYHPYRRMKGTLQDGTEVESSEDPNWMLPTIELDMIRDLTDALRELHDSQNGSPLPKYELEWNAAMEKTLAALKISEPYLESKGIKLE